MLPEEQNKYHFILASHSPRRQQLLQDAGIVFELASGYEVAEEYPSTLPAQEVARYLSALKARAYPFLLHPRDILITADTTVVLDNKVLGKPSDASEAREMLSQLSGRSHQVITGVTLRSCNHTLTFDAVSSVHFRPLLSEEIDYYISVYRPFDKAGAYGIQEWIGYIGVERIEGCYYNIMGLPLFQLFQQLNQFIADQSE